ncbi:MAG: rhomboid family intramembrane serine protease [Clostridiaceae bacterium]|nr:rhomboid family intramembrane serine protease [Clostridiaceae bacterium]
MDKFIKKYYEYLANHEGFYINEFECNNNRRSLIAVKKFSEGIYAIVLTNAVDEGEIEECSHKYLQEKYGNYKLHMIVLTDANMQKNESGLTSKMYINNKISHIIYCDKDCEILKTIALAILNNKKSKRILKNKLVTIILITINVIVFLISAIIANNIVDIDGLTLLHLGAKYGPLIKNGQIWRLLTCTFLHGGLMHIACNMYSLYIIGPQIQMTYGKIKYIILYFICGISSSLLSYIVSPNTISVGASGAIFGLMGALLMYAIINRDKLNKGVVSNLFVVIVINLWIGTTVSNIDNLGHIGGLISGLIIGGIFSLSKIKKSS